MLQLTTNAVQHTSVGSRIRLGSRFAGTGPDKTVTFWVGDDGPGIEPDDIERIFARFDRGGGPSHTTTGAGLGLSIVSAIARGHHGSAHAESALGQGATFYIVIPTPEGPHEQ